MSVIVNADFNNRGLNNMVRVSLQHFPVVPYSGLKVILVDGSDVFTGTIDSIDGVLGEIYVDMDWEPVLL